MTFWGAWAHSTFVFIADLAGTLTGSYKIVRLEDCADSTGEQNRPTAIGDLLQFEQSFDATCFCTRIVP